MRTLFAKADIQIERCSNVFGIGFGQFSAARFCGMGWAGRRTRGVYSSPAARQAVLPPGLDVPSSAGPRTDKQAREPVRGPICHTLATSRLIGTTLKGNPAMRRGRENPSWGTSVGAITHIATEFEMQVRQLGLRKQAYAASAKLRSWCEHNKNRCYIPEWLLEEWGISVDAYASPTRRLEIARSQVVSFVKTTKVPCTKRKRSA